MRPKKGFGQVVEYDHYGPMAAKKTTYRGVTFRSQLEARWAAWFDLAGFFWAYEPKTEHRGWRPDFVFEARFGGGESIEFFAEVKPISLQKFPVKVAEKIIYSHPYDHGENEQQCCLCNTAILGESPVNSPPRMTCVWTRIDPLSGSNVVKSALDSLPSDDEERYCSVVASLTDLRLEWLDDPIFNGVYSNDDVKLAKDFDNSRSFFAWRCQEPQKNGSRFWSILQSNLSPKEAMAKWNEALKIVRGSPTKKALIV
jgi:hypothetical protein